MRPKKICLCVGSDPHALSVLIFMLKTNGYAVLEATSAAQALKVASEMPFEILLCLPLQNPGTDDYPSGRVIERIKEMNPFAPSILIAPATAVHADCPADARLDPGCPPAELLERIKVMSARKRGPRKAPAVRPTAAVPQEKQVESA